MVFALNWLARGRSSPTVLFVLSIFTMSLALFVILLNDIGVEERNRIVNLLQTDGAQAYAVFGIIVLIFIGILIAQLFFGSIVLHLIAKIIFRISINFVDFYKVIKIFYIFISFGLLWQLIDIIQNSFIFSALLNPFIILGLIQMYLLIKYFSSSSSFKSFLFVIFFYSSYLVILNLSLGG